MSMGTRSFRLLSSTIELCSNVDRKDKLAHKDLNHVKVALSNTVITNRNCYTYLLALTNSLSFGVLASAVALVF